MSPQIDQRLRHYFNEAANAVPVTPPTRFQPTTAASRSSTRRRARPLALVAIAAAISIVAGLIVIRDREHGTVPNFPPLQSPAGTTSTDASIPSTDPALFAPAASASLSVTGHTVYSPAPTAAGAVIAPDGRMFGIVLGPFYSDVVRSGDVRHIGGFDVRVTTDATAPEEIYRTIDQDCFTLGITTAGEPALSANTETLINGLTIADDNINFALPTGWSSLGSSASAIQYRTDLQFTTDESTTDLTLFQMPNTPISGYLASFETAPQKVDINGDTAWVIPGATTNGFTEVVGERDGTVFRLGGLATADQLVAIAESFTRAPLANWTNESNNDPTETTPETTQGPPDGCTIPPLSITPNG